MRTTVISGDSGPQEVTVSPLTLLDGLVGYYNLDETGAFDDAVDSAAGIGDLAPSWATPATGGPGIHGARDVGQNLSSFYQGGFSALSSVPLSFNIWAYQYSDVSQTLLRASGDLGFGFKLDVVTDGGLLEFTISGEGGSHDTGWLPGSWAVAQWNMFTIVYDASNWWVYVNGVELGTGSHIVTSFSDVNSLFEMSSYPDYVSGCFSLAGFWNRALSAGEVDALYNFGNGLNYGEL